MSCPKCKAKIGIIRHRFAIESGMILCSKCCICGFLVQEYRQHHVPSLAAEEVLCSKG